jgi:hypothetical protein
MDKSSRRGYWWQWCFAVLVIGSAVPLWLVEYPPLQDLPQHLAAIRVLHSFRDGWYGFENYFTIDLFRTQYLTYYLAADLLAYLFGVVWANKLLLTLSLCATPYAMRRLLGALGRDQRLALFVLPLTYNAQLIFGFFNFTAAIALTLYGLALAVEQRRAPTTARAVLWSLLALVTFYTHVVPFGFLALGAVLVGIGRDPIASIKRLLPLIPAAAGAALWLIISPAGEATRTAVAISKSGAGPRPEFQTWRQALEWLPTWLTDIFQEPTGKQLLQAWALLAIAAIAFGIRIPRTRQVLSRNEVPHEKIWAADRLQRSLSYRIALLAPLAAVAYFVMPVSYDWIWPISLRFPLLAAIFLVAALPSPQWKGSVAVFIGVAVVAGLQFYTAGRAFRAFEREEVGDLPQALQVIPRAERVAGLIWRRGSQYVRFSPFIHAVAYYQAQKGGAVMFSFADFAHSPFRFREDNRPPRVYPRWEWTPERVDPVRDLKWYNYLLMRGVPSRLSRYRLAFTPVYSGRQWSVWKRVSGSTVQ